MKRTYIVKKTEVLIPFGGHKFEHDASLISASNIIPFFNKDKFNLNLLYIKPTGEWHICDRNSFLCGSDDIKAIVSSMQMKSAHLEIGIEGGARLKITETGDMIPVDLVFSAMTGKVACDGVMQGLWKSIEWPVSGPDLLGAAIGFDKDVMKRLLSEAGLPVCPYRMFTSRERKSIDFDELKEIFGEPFFMKPANSGSSLGANIIRNKVEFEQGLEDAFRYDNKLMVEEYISGSELELYCIGIEDEVHTTIIRETVCPEGFWSYEAKYVTDNVEKYIPARISPETEEEVKNLTQKAYRVLEGHGLARMDFFHSADGTLYINEINTAPVFMSNENQPPLWELSDISYEQLVNWMVKSALVKSQN